MIYLARSNLAKLILFFSFVSLSITTVKYLSLKIFTVQCIVFFLFIRTVDCNIYGKCFINAYFYTLLAFIITLFLISDYFGIFNEYKKAVRRFYSLYDSSNGTNFKNIIFPKENEITDYYKNRSLPRIINKNFKHKTLEEELDEDDIEVINNNNNTLLDGINNNIAF